MSASPRSTVTREGALVAALLLLLALAVLYPLLRVFVAALRDGGTAMAFVARPLFRQTLVDTLLAGGFVVLLGSVIAVPLAVLTVRYTFPGRALIGALALLPLAIPTFVGAIAFRQILGPTGTVNLLLREHAGVTIPFMDGLRGVVLVQSFHFFPFIMLGTAAALSALDRALEESAQSLGASGGLLLRRVVLPLALPGYVAGALLAVIRVLDDLGAPLMLNYTTLLAPQAYLRINEGGVTDADGYVICAVLVVLSLGALWAAKAALARGERARIGRGRDATVVRLAPMGIAVAWLVALFVLGPALLPQVGVGLLSVAGAWSGSPLPTAYTLDHFRQIFSATPPFIWNTARYALLAALIDVGLGAAIAWVLLRGRVPGRRALGPIVTVPLAVAGVVMAAGYLRVFHGWNVPGLGVPITSTSLLLVAVYAVRRLPYTVRVGSAPEQARVRGQTPDQVPGLTPSSGAVTAAWEEAAENLGATGLRTLVTITLPLMARGLVAGGLLAFAGAAVDLSATMLLVPRVELGPLSYGVVHLYTQSAGTRGAAAALGVVAIALVAAAAWMAARLANRSVDVLFRA